MIELNLYKIDLKYIRDLSDKDDNVMSVSPQIQKAERPFLGIVVLITDNEQQRKYCIPLSSVEGKEKFTENKVHGIDCIKVFNEKLKNEKGAPKLIAVLNLNNMIPVEDDVIHKLTFDTDNCPKSDIGRRVTLNRELDWCRDNADLIVRRAQKVYNLVTLNPEKDPKLVRRSCNFKLLEEVLDVYLGKKQEADIATPQKGKTLNKDNNPFRPKKLKEQQKNIDTKYQNQNKNQNKQKKKRHSH